MNYIILSVLILAILLGHLNQLKLKKEIERVEGELSKRIRQLTVSVNDLKEDYTFEMDSRKEDVIELRDELERLEEMFEIPPSKEDETDMLSMLDFSVEDSIGYIKNRRNQRGE